MNNKTAFRIKAKNIRETLDIDKISRVIISKINNLELYKKSKNIMIFYPLEKEINLLPLLDNSDKNFYLPRIVDKYIVCCSYKNGDKLESSQFKTMEPLTEKINPNILDMIFVPALMVDKNNYRLGYGKGFYDRFLKTTQAITIVPIAKELIVEKLPTESHDMPINKIITQ